MSTITLTQPGARRLTNAERVVQRRDALVIANEARRRKSRTKRRIAALDRVESARMVAGMLRDPSPDVADLEIGETLLAVRKYGKRAARPLLARNRISVWARLGELSERQRDVIASELEALAHRRAGYQIATEDEVMLLAQLIDADGGMICSQLASIVATEGHSINSRLRGLRIRGLLRSERGSRDARGRKVLRWFITEDGRRVVREGL